MPPGSPTRLETGQANGAEATSPTGNVLLVRQCCRWQGGTVLKGDKEVSWIQETMECMAKVAQGMWVWMDKVSKVWQVAQVVGFNKVHVKVLVDARAVEFSRVHAKVFNKDVKDFKVAQAVEFSKVHV